MNTKNVIPYVSTVCYALYIYITKLCFAMITSHTTIKKKKKKNNNKTIDMGKCIPPYTKIIGYAGNGIHNVYTWIIEEN